jgi:DnaJ like chaperone protein
MTFWRTITRLAARRPARDECPDCPDCPDGLPGRDPGFSAAVTALGAKLAKADGQAEPAEFVAFSEVFVPGPAGQRDVRRLYDLARQTTRGFESYARQLARRYQGCPGVLEEVLEGLFHIAKADGIVTFEEQRFLERVAVLFGMSPLTWRRILAEQIGAPADDPYVILGVRPDATDVEVNAAWKSALLKAHPDRAAALGLTKAEAATAEARSAAINAAHDQVMRERNAWTGAEPA